MKRVDLQVLELPVLPVEDVYLPGAAVTLQVKCLRILSLFLFVDSSFRTCTGGEGLSGALRCHVALGVPLRGYCPLQPGPFDSKAWKFLHRSGKKWRLLGHCSILRRITLLQYLKYTRIDHLKVRLCFNNKSPQRTLAGCHKAQTKRPAHTHKGPCAQ